uniref:Secreted protein n=1 Tax=Steinernema glaseri TaxID=37863 RepID=A0A1I8AR03_9BILA
MFHIVDHCLPYLFHGCTALTGYNAEASITACKKYYNSHQSARATVTGLFRSSLPLRPLSTEHVALCRRSAIPQTIAALHERARDRQQVRCEPSRSNKQSTLSLFRQPADCGARSPVAPSERARSLHRQSSASRSMNMRYLYTIP